MTTKHTVVALVRNRPGVLTRVASLFRRRLFNIESLAVGHAEQPGMSRMTIAFNGNAQIAEQVVKQLYKLIDVVKVNDVTEEATIQRELAMIKVTCPPEKRAEVFPLIETLRAKVVDLSADTIIVEITGQEEKVDALIGLLKPYGIKEIVRTGRVAMVRTGIADDSRPAIRAIGA